MSKPTDPQSFATYVEGDFTWRVRELSDLKSGVKGSPRYQATLRKAALPLVYAHWEGHVKFVAEAYLGFVSRRKFPVSKISKNLTVVALHHLFEQISDRRLGYSERIEVLAKFESSITGRFSSIPKDYLNTGSNLGYSRFCDICKLLAVDPKMVISDANFLDKKVLEKRNFIAHGEEQYVETDEIEAVISFIIEAMRSFRDNVVNLIAQESYKIT